MRRIISNENLQKVAVIKGDPNIIYNDPKTVNDKVSQLIDIIEDNQQE
ncbi:MAG: hypothetical protein K6E10_05275 [Eubacterium sp.]|nr:hypothetical protein [Eubacterium sp.]